MIDRLKGIFLVECPVHVISVSVFLKMHVYFSLFCALNIFKKDYILIAVCL